MNHLKYGGNMPYVIIVYDIDIKRVGKVNKFLKRFLYWRQNSVFEGEIRKSDLEFIKMNLNEIIKDQDNIIIYSFDQKYLNCTELGYKKSKVNENII